MSESTRPPPPAVQLRTLILLAEGYALLGWLDPLLKAYAEAGVPPPKATLVACGDAALNHGFSQTAVNAYAKAGEIEKILACGRDLAAKHFDRAALETFMVADDKAVLIAFGDECLDRDEHAACLAYRAGGAGREQFMACADRALAKDNLPVAIMALAFANAPNRLIEIGNAYLAQRQTDKAREAFQAAANLEFGLSPY